jgi:hypothetical protein
VWIGYPKVRVVGFEGESFVESEGMHSIADLPSSYAELSAQDARHIFYHHASHFTSIEDSKGGSRPLPCFKSDPDHEGFAKGRVGQHKVPFKLVLPIGKGAKGSWKTKQGAVRYIVIA